MTGTLSKSQRDERRSTTRKDKFRSNSRQDRDRVRFSRQFRRLSGVTQVAHSEESYLYHERLTHSMKVAQVASSLSRIFLIRNGINPVYSTGRQLGTSVSPPSTSSLATSLDPYVVEAAAHTHDIGHSPFGHIGEITLDDLVQKYSQQEVGEEHGFEGNAQSFRIVTSLAHYDEAHGMNLTRATINGMLKYPWDRTADEAKDNDGVPAKWGYYTDPGTADKEVFNWAREPLSDVREREMVLEAQIMDYADDLTYAVHDLNDFFRAGIIPLDQLLREAIDEEDPADPELRKYGVAARDELTDFENYLASETDIDPDSFGVARFLTDIASLADDVQAITLPFKNTDAEHQALKQFASALVARYLEANRSKDPKYIDITHSGSHYDLEIHPDFESEIEVLKSLTQYYVISNPTLMQQQSGQIELLENIYEDLYQEAEKVEGANFPRSAIPEPFQGRLKHAGKSDAPVYRTVSDMVASLTEQQALILHERLRGWSPGSLQNTIIG